MTTSPTSFAPPSAMASTPTVELAADIALLQALVARTDQALAALPAREMRDAGQSQQAQALLGTLRLARQRVARCYGPSIHDALTAGGTRRLRLSALCAAAADRFPGLVPSDEQMRAERHRAQADKDGHERDMAVFLAELLGHPQVGEHMLQSMRMACPRALELQADYRSTGLLRLASVHLERREGIAWLTLCNADTLNAEDDALVSDLEVASDLALMDPQVRVGVLRGGPVNHPKYAGRRIFSAGINLKHLHAGRISLVEFLLERETGFISKIYQGLLVADDANQLQRISKPWLAAVDGFAIGGGTQLLLVFDSVVAAADSYFCLPAAKEGIVPGVANLRLGRHLGAKLARRIILHGHVVHARDPEARLLIDEVVEPERMDEAIESALRALDNPAVAANRAILNLAEEPLSLFRAYMADFAQLQADRAYSQDVQSKAANYVLDHAGSASCVPRAAAIDALTSTKADRT